MVLDGIEKELKSKIRKFKIKGKVYYPKVNFIRYADDFIVTGDSKEILEEKVKPIIIVCRHIWEEYIEKCENIRHRSENI